MHDITRKRICALLEKKKGGGFRQIGEIYANIFLAVHILFSETRLQVRPFGGFLHAMAQTMRSRARMCLLEI